jgi:transposase
MAMGRRKKRVRQEGLWTPTAALPVNAGHPFYQRLNQILDEKKFDEYVEAICEEFYAGEVGRPGLSPGIYFRLLMVGYFEGIDSERGIAWRASDSLSIRAFVRIALDESVPDHSTISRTRRLMDVETHQAVFQWVLAVLAEEKLLKGPRSAWTRRRWKPTQRCGRLCGAIPASATRSSSRGWRRKAASKRPRGSS